jgi:hypothetical protein
VVLETAAVFAPLSNRNDVNGPSNPTTDSALESTNPQGVEPRDGIEALWFLAGQEVPADSRLALWAREGGAESPGDYPVGADLGEIAWTNLCDACFSDLGWAEAGETGAAVAE